MKCRTLAGFGLGLITGVIAGGVIALLYAPKAGKVTRQLFKDAATDVADTVKEASNGVVATVRRAATGASRKRPAALKPR